MEREKGVASHDDHDGDGGGAGPGVVVGGKEDEFLLGAKLRRGIALGKRGGLCTPVPSWKLGAGPSGGSGDNPAHGGGAGGATVSARKLGANLWEIQDLTPVLGMSRRGGKARHHQEEKGFELVDPGSENPHDRPRSAGSLRRHSTVSLIQRHKATHRNNRAMQPVSPGSYSSSMEIAAYNQDMTPACSLDLKEKLRDSRYSIKTSTELLKVLNRIWSLEEQNASNMSLVKALKLELASARARIQELLEEQRADRQEIDNLLKQVVEDKLIRKSRERERVRAAVQSVMDKFEEERRLRIHSESLHRSLAKELSEVKSLYSKALKDVERQRKENASLEDLCDEFAKGIGDYEQEVRQLKQKHEKDFGPICDRLVLHISEAWLDERMQMKLAESRGDFSERDSIIERLGCEVEAFLQAKQNEGPGLDVGIMAQSDTREDNYLRRQSLESLYLNGAVSGPQDAEDEDSIASDLHCFELNMRTEGVDSSVSAAGKFEEPQICNLARKKTGYPEKIQGHGPFIMSKEFKAQGGAISPRSNKSKMKFMDNEVVHVYCKPGSSGIQDGRENREDMRSKWDGGNGSSTKGQLDFKIHPEDDEDNASADRIHLRGKSIAVSSYIHSGSRFYGSSSALHQNLKFPAEAEITESALELPQGVRENTLKAKLLEARLEGRQAHRRMSKGLAVGG